MKNFLCKIGLHDWEIINSFYHDWDWEGLEGIHDKMCLRCNKKKEKIGKYFAKQEKKKERNTIAKELWIKNG